MTGAAHEALGGVRARGGRALLRALGIALAAAMLTVAATVAYGLRSGFSRSAGEAHLPDVIARFDAVPASEIAARIRALPDVAAFALRREFTGVGLAFAQHEASDGVAEALESGPHGYALVAGRDISPTATGVVLEVGLARAWGVLPGDSVSVAGLGSERVEGLARSPDNVAFPLAAPRVYLSRATLARAGAAGALAGANVAEIWVRRQAGLDAMLVQARTTSYGLHDLSILTRSGVRVLIDEAAGIVIALLAALSLVALLTAAVMLAASERAELQRRLRALGIRRAIGASRAHIARLGALEALVIALPAGALGVLAGALASIGPSERLLLLLNESPPGVALVPVLLACLALTVAIPVALACWQAWRATAAAPVSLLRGAELSARPPGGRSLRRARGGGLVRLGARLASARRARLGASVASLAVCSGFVLLLLALALELSAIENDPAALGRRYQLTVALPATASARVRALPGVEAAAPRYEESALDAFSLGEVIDVIAYAGRQETFEDPPLQSGAAAHGPQSAEVGAGLAQVLGLGPGSTLVMDLADGAELHLRVSGIVSSLQHDGRVAYVPAGALLAADPSAPEQLVVRDEPSASADAVSAELHGLGAGVNVASGTVSASGGALVGALRALLRSVAAVDLLVCLYALVQALALTASERRRAIALLRACGAGPRAVYALLTGAALVIVLPAAIIAVALERFALGPAIAHIAAGYAALALAAGTGEVAATLAGLALLACGAVFWVARRSLASPVAGGLA